VVLLVFLEDSSTLILLKVEEIFPFADYCIVHKDSYFMQESYFGMVLSVGENV